MTLNKIVFPFFAFIVLSFSVKAQTLESFVPKYAESDMYQIKKDHELVWKDVAKDKQKGWKQYKRWEYFWSQRLFPNADYQQSIKIYQDVQKQVVEKKFDVVQSNQWNLIGPVDNPQKYNSYIDSKGLGRVNIVRFHPTNENEIWIGTATGGVWKTTDKGKTWINFPFTQFLSLGVSDIAISRTNPKIVYVATGDADGSLGTAGFYSSIGIIKSVDGGITWEVTGMANELADRNIVSRLIVHPDNPDIVIAACVDGIYKTIDGGKIWEKKQSGSFRDLELKPNSNSFVYAATAQRSVANYIYNSNDFGDTWTFKYEVRLAGRIQLAVSPADPEVVFALCSQYQHSGFHSFLTSYDSGETFEKSIDSNYRNLLNWGTDLGTDQRGQSYYDLCLAIAPNDVSNVILGGIECHRSLDGGYNWNRVTNITPATAATNVHADMHDLEYNPLNKELYLCNDGGIYVSKDNGKTWSDLSTGLSITQYYRIGMSAKNQDMLVCGAQDNGSSMYLNGSWNMLYGGDGMDCAIDPTDDNILYVSIYNGTFVRSKDKGKTMTHILNENLLKTRYGANESGAWIAPFVINPQKPSTIYAGFNNLWKSTNYGVSWSNITNNTTSSQPMTWISIAPSDTNYIYYVVNNDLYKTANGGTNWERIYSASKIITSVTVSPNNPNLIWFTLSGYSENDKVMMYDGTNFTNLSGNLPNVPVNTIVYQKGTKDRLYIGTDIGIFYSENKSNIWDNINSNLPNLIISELEIFYGSEVPKLRAATYGRGVWETDVITCNEPELALSRTEDVITICPYEFVELTAGGDYSNYTWTNGEVGKTIKINTDGIYSVSALKGDCKLHSKTVEVKIIPTAKISAKIAGNALACIGDTIELSATLGFKSYLWSTGQTEQKIKVTNSGNYYVSGSKNTECTSYSDTLKVIFTEKPSKPKFVAHGSRLIADSITAYQWYLDGVLIPNSNSRIYNTEKSGNYKLLGFNEAGCSTFSDEMYVEYSSVDDNFSHPFTISPNPSKGEFKFDLTCQPNDLVEYTVIDALGAILSTSSARSNNENFHAVINLSNYADGVYMLKIKVNSDNKTVKLIKK